MAAIMCTVILDERSYKVTSARDGCGVAGKYTPSGLGEAHEIKMVRRVLNVSLALGLQAAQERVYRHPP